MFSFSRSIESFAAALTSVALVILSAIYLVPFGSVVCGGLYVSKPGVQTGDLSFQKPETIILTVKSDRTTFLGPAFVPSTALTRQLAEHRRRFPGQALQIDASGRLKLGELQPVFAAARKAGYASFYVFGDARSILDATALKPDAQLGAAPDLCPQPAESGVRCSMASRLHVLPDGTVPRSVTGDT